MVAEPVRVTLADAYTETARAVPGFAAQVTAVEGAELLPGQTLSESDWLDARVRQACGFWRTDDRRVAATLWWYSASSILVGVPAGMLLVAGAASDPTLDRLTITTRPDGSLASVTSRSVLREVEELAQALRGALELIITALADVSGAGPRALWSLATDSLGNRLLDAGTAIGSPGAGSALAVALAQRIDPLPPPRFVDVRREGEVLRPADTELPETPPPGARRFVRRDSCCLIYRTAGNVKCLSCPQQPPAERIAGLAALV